MQDALGSPQTIAVLGGTSEIALATVRRMAADRLRRVVLAVRDPDSAKDEAVALERLGLEVELLAFDARDTASHRAAIEQCFAQDIDAVLLAFGVLGDQSDYDADPEQAVEAVEVNFVGAVSCGLLVAEQLRRQGDGTLIVLSSVAAERPRQSMYVYGASKAGLDAFAQGLGDALVGSGARVLVVRPGFVHTRMTAGRPVQPFATTPEAVAEAVVRGLERGRDIVWAPGLLRWVFAALRHLPRPLWRVVSAR
jgi:decaprenylphospho-beta-D-erythro-pentofuranosid-2-ulose 2-reductase